MRHFGAMLKDVRKQYDQLRSRDRELICADGFYMDCDVLKLRKAAWTNDDPTKITSPSGGIFFSIWVTDEGAKAGRASYNIHSYRVRGLKNYHLTSHEFCDAFRSEFAKVREAWPNVSTDFGVTTLMEGWFSINEKSFPRDALNLMKKFEEVAEIIDELLKRRKKSVKADAADVEC